jgi:thiol:disulfide interchange protein DsbD
LALPFALLSTLESLSRLLPRPGVWMEQLRQFMVFPMAATVLWLLWVLASMGGVNAALAMAALLLVLAMCIWAAGLQGTSRRGFVVLSLLIVVPVAWIALPLVWDTAQDSTPAIPAQGQAGHAQWQPWSQAGVEQAVAAGQPVFVDFTAAWCITCQYNKQTVLSDAGVLSAFAAKNVTLMRADWTLRDAAISAALGQLGRSGVPVYVLYRKDQAPVVLSEVLTVAEVQAALAGW